MSRPSGSESPCASQTLKLVEWNSTKIAEYPKKEDPIRNTGKSRKHDQIFVKLPGNATIAMDMNLDRTVEDLKERIYLRVGIPQHEQRLIFGGKQLESNRTLRSFCITTESTIMLLLRLCGGMQPNSEQNSDNSNNQTLFSWIYEKIFQSKPAGEP